MCLQGGIDNQKASNGMTILKTASNFNFVRYCI